MDSSNPASHADHPHPFLELSPKLVPEKFIWPREQENPNSTLHEQADDLNEPLIDLQGFFNGDKKEIQRITEQVRSVCLSHGLFQVINHGVDLELIESVRDQVKGFFRLPIDEKMRAQRAPGRFWGYSLAHADRFSLNLPWKETISCFFPVEDAHDSEAAAFFDTAFPEASEQTGWIFLNYCKAMKRLSLTIMEILGISLGLSHQSYLKDFFRDGGCIMRCNLYPPCQEPGLTLGTGPHCDPTALTILHQDLVGGLQVLTSDQKWKSVAPRQDALVVNLGDTLVALTNGEYKSCKHRAVVNKARERVSVVVFLCPREDKVIAPPEDLASCICTAHDKGDKDERRPRFMYPHFTWSEFLYFTHHQYRVDLATLQNFTTWLRSSRTKET